jgi:hypothetical protein
MGNACPSGFVALGDGCVHDCNKLDTLFMPIMVDGQPKCALQTDNTQGVVLKPLSGVPVVSDGSTFRAATLQELQTKDATLFATYQAEQTRVTEELAVLNEKLGKDRRLKAAFQKLQDAENARDQAPQAYQKARADYYVLLKGDTWLQEERDRMARAEVDPIVQKYTNEYVSLTGQIANQTQAYDTMTSIKDKVFRVKDDLNYSADLLVGQVDKIKSQIALDRRKRDEGSGEPAWVEWVDLALNILLVLALVAAAWFVIKKLRAPKAPAPAFTEATSPP